MVVFPFYKSGWSDLITLHYPVMHLNTLTLQEAYVIKERAHSQILLVKF